MHGSSRLGEALANRVPSNVGVTNQAFRETRCWPEGPYRTPREVCGAREAIRRHVLLTQDSPLTPPPPQQQQPGGWER